MDDKTTTNLTTAGQSAETDSTGRKLLKLGVVCLICVGLALGLALIVQSLIS